MSKGDTERGERDADALCDDLRRVAALEETSDPPTTADYDAHGRWSSSTAARHLSDGAGHSWPDALDAAGLDGDTARERAAERRPPDPDEVCADLRRVADRDDTDDPPTAREYDRHGEWRAETVARRLGDGSWADAVGAAGLDGDAVRDRTSGTSSSGAGELCADLRRVADRGDTSDPPTVVDYETHGEWAVSTVKEHLGGERHSWADALDAAGLDGDAARERGPEGAPDEAALRRDLRRVAAREDTGDPPTKAEYDAHGEWAASTVARRLGGDGHSWPAALDDVGLDGDEARRRGGGAHPTDEAALREDLRRVAALEETADPPTRGDYAAHGRWEPGTVVRHLGSGRGMWAAALDVAGLDGDAARSRGGVTAATPRADLVADVEEVAARDDTDDPPTQVDYETHGEWSVGTVVRRLGKGSWPGVLDAAGLDGDAARERVRCGSVSADALRADLERVADRGDTRTPPTAEDYEAHGEWPVATATRHLAGDADSWPAVLDAAGLDGDAARERAADPGAVGDDALRADLRRVAALEETADPPAVTDYSDHGDWPAAAVADRLGDGSWYDALDAAGLDGDAARVRDGGTLGAEAVADDLERVARRDDTMSPPSRPDYREHGRWGLQAATTQLEADSWADALDAAGLDGDAARERASGGGGRREDGDSTGHAPVAVAVLLQADLRRVAAREDTGDPPTRREYDDHGDWAASTVARHFGDGSWADALEEAGLDGGGPDNSGGDSGGGDGDTDGGGVAGPDGAAPRGGGGGGPGVGDDALRDDLRRVAAREDTGDPPTVSDYDEWGTRVPSTLRRQFGSWPAALDAAGLDGDAARERRTTGPAAAPDALRRDLQRVAELDDTADPPSRADYEVHGEWAAETVASRLGGGPWAAALDAAGLDGDAARERIPDGCRGADADDLRRDLARVAARPDTATPPTADDYDAHGRWHSSTLRNRLGDGYSWGGVLEAAGLRPPTGGGGGGDERGGSGAGAG